MNQEEIEFSSEFQTKIKRATFSIIIFVFAYILLLTGAIAFTGFLGLSGISLVMVAPSILTILLSFVILGLGLLVLYFLVRFMFKFQKKNMDDRIEIFPDTQPEVFDLIDKVVEGTDSIYPNKVFITHEVNASVSVSSNLFSMLLPIKQDLIIGAGLMHSLNVSELESVLAHEFGHFSQKGTKLGAFVYNINRIIHNMFYDNDSLSDFIARYSQSAWPIRIVLKLGVAIIMGILRLLFWLYQIVNKNYLALSREMEFQADAVATRYSGKEPMLRTLLRTDLAAHCYSDTLGYFNNRLSDNATSNNIYPLYSFTLGFLAEKNNIELRHGFPDVQLENVNAYNTSKINVENQWASHPSLEDRIANIISVPSNERPENTEPAISLLRDRQEIEEKLTKYVFSTVKYTGLLRPVSLEDYKSTYKTTFKSFEIDPYFRNYYRFTDPATKVKSKKELVLPTEAADFYSDENLQLVKKLAGLNSDLQLLDQIEDKESGIKTFDYDGQKYKVSKIAKLRADLIKKQGKVKKKVDALNQSILQFTLDHSEDTKQGKKLRSALKDYKNLQKDISAKEADFEHMGKLAEFLQETISGDIIEQKQLILMEEEDRWRAYLTPYRKDGKLALILGPEVNAEFEKYLDNDYDFFNGHNYDDNVVGRFYFAMAQIPEILYQLLYLEKKDICKIMKKIMLTDGTESSEL